MEAKSTQQSGCDFQTRVKVHYQNNPDRLPLYLTTTPHLVDDIFVVFPLSRISKDMVMPEYHIFFKDVPPSERVGLPLKGWDSQMSPIEGFYLFVNTGKKP